MGHGPDSFFDRTFVYYEEIKRELNRILIYECRCNDRLQGKVEGSTRLRYTGLRGGLEHLKMLFINKDRHEVGVEGPHLEITKKKRFCMCTSKGADKDKQNLGDQKGD